MSSTRATEGPKNDGTIEKPLPQTNLDNADAESLQSEMFIRAKEEGVKPAFLAKVALINEAIAETGMGRYQWELFMTSGFGWMADNLCEHRPSILLVTVKKKKI